MNNLKTGLLLTLLTVLLVGIGSVIGGRHGAMIAFVMALVTNIGAYWFSDSVVLKMYRAREVTEQEEPKLFFIVAELAQRAELSMPKVYRIPSPALNAFATGRSPKHAAIAVTEGLEERMSREELKGVLAHELSHVKHRDTLISTITATMAGAISLLGTMARWGAMMGGSRDSGGSVNIFAILVLSIVSGFAAMIVQMAISRSREFEADAGAARIVGDPSGLISALRKLEAGSKNIPLGGSPATAHMFIINPFTGGLFARLFRTHPTTEERIERLRSGTFY